ncbi:GntR family transcriptional regulator [Paractinoplanes deccanensis]|uniref:GntR family transcriptional regulator n=1 Tax=Paractinoplanes deccanensis TaxID=113561 RepID=A0ABQ3YBJ2_9ACTN|nr:GntR family transcriptional regulator [Actinoplanes deccanensis]GID77336.1 GntR family transcriptional regulator [Actinoplanes deccanensis]
MSADLIADRVRSAIRRGDLLPGARLVQEKLAADLAVSRIPLREALHMLAAEGLLVSTPNRGMVVAELGRDQLEELFDLRLQLEPGLAEQIVRGCRPRDADALADLAEQIHLKGADAAARAALNYQFHARVYELADRPLTTRFVDQLLHLVEPYSRQWVRSGRDLHRIDAEHRQMVDAIRAGNADALARVIVAHILGARDHVLAAR